MPSCIFCQIRDREIPKEFTYEDSDVMVFPDIHPVKPVHLLIVPKVHMADFLALDNDGLWTKLRKILQRMIKEQDLETKGYKLIVNGGGAQIIDHLHIHLIGPVGKEAKL